jgi:hypothetical protein
MSTQISQPRQLGVEQKAKLNEAEQKSMYEVMYEHWANVAKQSVVGSQERAEALAQLAFFAAEKARAERRELLKGLMLAYEHSSKCSHNVKL